MLVPNLGSRLKQQSRFLNCRHAGLMPHFNYLLRKYAALMKLMSYQVRLLHVSEMGQMWQRKERELHKILLARVPN